MQYQERKPQNGTHEQSHRLKVVKVRYHLHIDH